MYSARLVQKGGDDWRLDGTTRRDLRNPSFWEEAPKQEFITPPGQLSEPRGTKFTKPLFCGRSKKISRTMVSRPCNAQPLSWKPNCLMHPFRSFLKKNPVVEIHARMCGHKMYKLASEISSVNHLNKAMRTPGQHGIPNWEDCQVAILCVSVKERQ